MCVKGRYAPRGLSAAYDFAFPRVASRSLSLLVSFADPYPLARSRDFPRVSRALIDRASRLVRGSRKDKRARSTTALRFGRVLINPARRGEWTGREEGRGRKEEEYAWPIVIATANDKRMRLHGNERKSRMKSGGCPDRAASFYLRVRCAGRLLRGRDVIFPRDVIFLR